MDEGEDPKPSNLSGVPADEFDRLLSTGRDRGSLNADDLMMVLETVELTPELIDSVVERVRAAGIVYDEPDVEPEPAVSVIDADADADVDVDLTPAPPTKAPRVPRVPT